MKMTRWGVGPRFTLLAVPYSILTIVVSRLWTPVFDLAPLPYRACLSIGVVLLVIGVPFNIIAMATVHRAFSAGRLITDGVFSLCRHPVYAAWVVFFVPAIALLCYSWLALTAPLLMYFVVKRLVHREEIYLGDKYGEPYRRYQASVPAIIPVGRLMRHFM